jgi:hypothetical protein
MEWQRHGVTVRLAPTIGWGNCLYVSVAKQQVILVLAGVLFA